MTNFLSKLVSPAGLLYVHLVLTQIAYAVFVTADFEPQPAFTLVYSVGFLWIIGWWLRADSRKRGVGWIYDMGLFLFMAWPFIMPYYLIKTRGARGLLAIVAYGGTYIVATLIGVTLYVLCTS